MKMLISLASFALAATAALAAPAPAPGLQAPAPLYDVSLRLTEGERVIGTPRLLMSDGDRSSLRVGGEGGYVLRLRLDRGAGGRFMLAAEIWLERDGRWAVAGSPSLFLAEGQTARIEIAAPAGGAGPVGLTATVAPASLAAATVEPPRPKATLRSLASMDDYPASALRAGEEGTVDFSLDVGPNGRVTGCTITRSSGSAVLDSTTCRILVSRARFTPARDDRGIPVPGRVSSSITWSIEDEPAPPDPG